MVTDLVKATAKRMMSLQLRVGSMVQEFKATESDIPKEGDLISRLLEYGILFFLLLLSIALRISLYKVVNGDYTNILKPLYDSIKAHGGYVALKDSSSDYNLAYLYLLAFASYFPIDPMVAIKSISVIFDLVTAFLVSLILRLKYQQSYIPILGAIAILFAPTVFINSAAWGQNDAIDTAWCLASLYCLLSKRTAWACVFFGLAFSFKLQALFFLPVLLVLLLKRKLAIGWLLLIPVVYLALLLPARLEGRDMWSLLTTYPRQINVDLGSLVMKAPTIYQWIPASDPKNWMQMGVILTIAMVAMIGFIAVRSRKPITLEIILKLTLIFAVAVPFFLPEIHERYFYLADVASIIYAFYFPRYFYLAIIEQLCSCMSVIPSLFGQNPTINLAFVAFAVLFIIVITVADLVQTLFPTTDRSAAMPSASRKDLSAMTAASVLPAEENASDVASSLSLSNGLSAEEVSKIDFPAEQKEKPEV